MSRPVVDPNISLAPLAPPRANGGLLDVFRRRYLLKLLVQKEVQARYQGSLLGVLWSYVQPFVRFCMYFFVMGLVLGLHKTVPNFAIHIFSALVIVTFFTSTFSAGTRSIIRNKAIVRKMAMPREMFPVASVIVSAINSFPQLVILLVASLSVGWTPDWKGVYAGALGLTIITVFGTALALLFSALNVFFRDFQNVVSTLTIFTHWIVPMIYPYSKLSASGLAADHPWVLQTYLADPLAIAVLLVQRCFWLPTSFPIDAIPKFAEPPDLILRGWIMLAVCLVFLAVSQMAFTRLESKFTERL
jgi:ABC-2 type transport system permease protein